MTRIYLLISAATFFAIGLSYGLAPSSVLPRILNVTIEGVDLPHVFRAIMGLYFALAALWVTGAFDPRFTQHAIRSEVFVMAGLTSSRVLSIVVDGSPSILLIAYMIGEFLFASLGIALLKKSVGGH